MEDMTKFFVDCKYSCDEITAKRRTDLFLTNRHRRGYGLVYSPLSKLSIEPEVTIIYGNPGQIMRLIRGYVYFTGEPIQSYFWGGLSCVEAYINCSQTKRAQVVIPGNGERVIAMTQDNEICFYYPSDQTPNLINGLKAEHDSGISRYPIPVYQLFSPQMPKKYLEFMKEMIE